MNWKKRSVFVLSLLALFVLSSVVSFASGANSKPVTIKLVTPFKQGHIIADASEAFKILIEEKTNGRIKVDLYQGYGSEISCSKECSEGTVDMQWAGGQPIQDFAPQYFFFNAPFVIKDYDHFERVWDSRLGNECRKQIEKNGNMLCFSTLYRGFRQTTANQAINGPADLAKLRLRLPLVPDWVTVWQALGATPVQYPLDQLYTVLKTGSAEASEGDLAQIASYKLTEVQSRLIMTDHLVAVGWSTANKQFFRNLSAQDQELIAKYIEQAAAWATLKTKLDEGRYLSQLKAAGMTVIIPDANAIRAKATPAVEGLFKKQYPVTTWAEVLSI